MKKEVVNHFLFFFSFFLLITLLKQYFSLSYWLFWVGGLAGTILPDVDHLLYIYVFKPIELTSQRVASYFKNKQYKEGIKLLYDTRLERRDLIFHNFTFLLIFAVVTFWVVSSSGSFFGRGLVLGFWLHLCVDHLKKYLEGEIIIADKQKSQLFIIGMFLLLFIFGVEVLECLPGALAIRAVFAGPAAE